MPNAAALSSEYVPRRHRPFAVTLTIVCIPLGGTLAGFVGAADPAALRLARALPGRRHRAARPGRRPAEGAAGVAALSRPAPAALARAARAAAAARPRRAAGRGVRRRHGEGRVRERRSRELLRAGVPARHAGAVRVVLLLPALGVHRHQLGAARCSPAPGSTSASPATGLTAFNLGGVVGAILGAIIIMPPRLADHDAGDDGRRRRRRARAGGDVHRAAVGLCRPRDAGVDRRPDQRRADDDVRARGARLSDGIRATGVGTAVAFGRIGGVVAPYAGSWALESGGASQMFTLIAGTMTVVFVALASVRRHIPRLSSPAPRARLRPNRRGIDLPVRSVRRQPDRGRCAQRACAKIGVVRAFKPACRADLKVCTTSGAIF